MDGLQVSGQRPSLATGTVLQTHTQAASSLLPPQQQCNKPPDDVCARTLVTQSCLTLCDLMDSVLQAPLSMGVSRQEYWSGLPFPPPGDLPDPGIEAGSPASQADSLPSEPRRGNLIIYVWFP